MLIAAVSATPSPSPVTRRSAQQTQISISLPRELLARIDAAATADKRNRSNFIAAQLEKLLPVQDGPEGDPKAKKKKKKRD